MIRFQIVDVQGQVLFEFDIDRHVQPEDVDSRCWDWIAVELGLRWKQVKPSPPAS